ncbi:MAG: beta-N-acetylhexosaminidase, partial [Saprospiraceae bacterium]|nr:beta-N-acetylhexosaminidase [Saprospiraceae bacterium]
GHGDTDTDSHFDLPVILHPRDRLDSIELFPFKVLAEQGIGSMMIAHLQVPALDTTAHLPTTLSRPTVTQVLREELGFDGLIVTDGLDMQGVRKYYEPGQIEAEALLAGNDILLLPPDVPAAYRAIRDYLRRGLLTEERIDESVRKVLKEKYRLGLLHPQAIELDHLEEDLNNTAALALKRRLIENSLTLVRNGRNLLPFREVDQGTMATL